MASNTRNPAARGGASEIDRPGGLIAPENRRGAGAEQQPGSNRLPHLAAVANDAHERTTDALRTAVESAREAGDALLEAKATVGHGKWTAWLSENFRGSHRTAERYMRIARHWSAIAAKATCVSNLSVNEALRLLEARTDLERAQILDAEVEALRVELDVFRAAVDTAEPPSLRVIIERSGEIASRLVEIRADATRELGRLIAEAS